jgi:hypothetical protein
VDALDAEQFIGPWTPHGPGRTRTVGHRQGCQVPGLMEAWLSRLGLLPGVDVGVAQGFMFGGRDEAEFAV